MNKVKEHFHGSDLEKVEKVFGIKKEDITSFGANVNPLGISPMLRANLSAHIDAITSYPDREYTDLRNAISIYTNAPLSSIMVGNGSTELIGLFIQIQNPKKALILSPTYSEYEREISLSGGSCLYHYLKEENQFHIDIDALLADITAEIDLLIICNPNNPTSTIIPRQEMEQIVKHCQKTDTFVLIDETYIEFSPDMEAVTSIPLTKHYPNMVILRGISKFFAAPGLRLGYSICSNEALYDRMKEIKNPWTINSLAGVAGEIMFSDHDYIHHSKAFTHTERAYCQEQLDAMDHVRYYDSYGNFILVKILKEGLTSSDLFVHCIKKGLMIRDCSDFAGLDETFVRFCFMSHEKNVALMDAFREVLS
ncbi:MAG: aminotransferase class I/II-fold pyridoxal phosphate-dependent enzyme [Anaerostipes sp.]|nr:aminotransferase class I/II-fold pyridoxal phosphate-dependent enzyme [Anaerostipes sp.]MDD5968078.1 histidinol-phosphate transaminase [Anaerostipes sp.]